MTMNIKQPTEPGVETERSINKAVGLLEDLRSNLPESWQRDKADQVLQAMRDTRVSFRDYMMDTSDQLNNHDC